MNNQWIITEVQVQEYVCPTCNCIVSTKSTNNKIEFEYVTYDYEEKPADSIWFYEINWKRFIHDIPTWD